MSQGRTGHEIADFALRELGAEMWIVAKCPTNIAKPIGSKRCCVAPVGRGRPDETCSTIGGRDIGIAVMVAMVRMHWPYLTVTRNRATKRPSASTIVALALRKHGYSLTEWQVERVSGDHNKLAGRLSASMESI